jgi:hypothetical protein
MKVSSKLKLGSIAVIANGLLALGLMSASGPAFAACATKLYCLPQSLCQQTSLCNQTGCTVKTAVCLYPEIYGCEPYPGYYQLICEYQ